MALVSLNTNLKSLKFGDDQYGGGSSNQPYVQVHIPATDEPLQTGFSISGDNIGSGLITIAAVAGTGAGVGAIVGGQIAGPTGAGTGAVAGAIVGAGAGLALAKSNGFKLNNFKIPSAGTGGTDFLLRGGTLLPGIIANDEERLAKFFYSTDGLLFIAKQNILSRTSVQTQASFGLAYGGTNQGFYTPLSTLAQAGVGFAGINLNLLGLDPTSPMTGVITDGLFSNLGLNRYGEIVSAIEKEDISRPIKGKINRLVQLFTEKILVQSDNLLWSYGGGPGSVLGIGKTYIYIPADQRTGINGINYDETEELLSQEQISDLGTRLDNKNKIGSPEIVDFRFLKNFPDYSLKNIETRLSLGDPGRKGNINNYKIGKLITDGKPLGPLDKINASGLNSGSNSIIYSSNGVNKTIDDYKDLVTFRIASLDSGGGTEKIYMHFRAFLDSFQDSYNADWQAQKYLGRGENFYSYNGFDRKISLSWTMYAQSKEELIPMYKKLNYLASNLAPDYSLTGYMRGPLVSLTLGGYLYEQPGFITSLTYDIPNESTWEIGIDEKGDTDPGVKQLPHMIRVTSFNFTPIHYFVPKKANPDDLGLTPFIALTTTEKGKGNYA
jgi:hypothetical protein